MVYSLNHDITESYTHDSDPEFPMSDLALTVKQSKGALTCSRRTSIKGAKTLYVYLM